MSMSICVIGFRPTDEKWEKMKAIWDSCEAADVEIPDNVDEFFNGTPPDAAGVEVEIGSHECCNEYRDEMSEGFEIDVSKLPKDLKIIRFYNSY